MRDSLRADVTHGGFSDAWSEAVDRLRDLRKQAAAEECWEFQEANTRNTIGQDQERGHKHNLICHLPRGHDGHCEASLGTWRWASR